MKHHVNGVGRTAVLLDPYPFCLDAMASLLNGINTTVVGYASAAAQAQALLEEHCPDLFLAELDLPEGREEGLRLIRDGRDAHPGLTVVVLSRVDDPEFVNAAFEAGAAAYVLKTAGPEDIRTAISQAFAPSIYLARWRDPQPVEAPLAGDGSLPRLTRRELEILGLVSEGRSNREVGQVLWITDQTVKFHLANVYRKLGVGSRYDAARWAREHGVLEVAESGEVVTLGTGISVANGNATDTLVHSVRRRRPTSQELGLDRELATGGGTSR